MIQLCSRLGVPWGDRNERIDGKAPPEQALEFLVELNNRYAVDGRDPNSYSGVFWCLGRYDRPWGPERPIIGNIRYMSSANTARKLRVKDYLRRFGTQGVRHEVEDSSAVRGSARPPRQRIHG